MIEVVCFPTKNYLRLVRSGKIRFVCVCVREFTWDVLCCDRLGDVLVEEFT